MSIKSDRWIREMAQTQGMIEPFEPEQVRYIDGAKVIAVGVTPRGRALEGGITALEVDPCQAGLVPGQQDLTEGAVEVGVAGRVVHR